jgi:hypothetical protein
MGDKKILTNLRNSQLKEGKNKIVHNNGNSCCSQGTAAGLT